MSTVLDIVNSLDLNAVSAITRTSLYRAEKNHLQKRLQILEKVRELPLDGLQIMIGLPNRKQYRNLVFSEENNNNNKKIHFDDATFVYTICGVSDFLEGLLDSYHTDIEVSKSKIEYVYKDNASDVIDFLNKFCMQLYGVDLLSERQKEIVLSQLKLSEGLYIYSFLMQLFSNDIVIAQLIRISLDGCLLQLLSEAHRKRLRHGIILELDDFIPKNVEVLKALQTVYHKPVKFILALTQKGDRIYSYPYIGGDNVKDKTFKLSKKKQTKQKHQPKTNKEI